MGEFTEGASEDYSLNGTARWLLEADEVGSRHLDIGSRLRQLDALTDLCGESLGAGEVHITAKAANHDVWSLKKFMAYLKAQNIPCYEGDNDFYAASEKNMDSSKLGEMEFNYVFGDDGDEGYVELTVKHPDSD